MSNLLRVQPEPGSIENLRMWWVGGGLRFMEGLAAACQPHLYGHPEPSTAQPKEFFQWLPELLAWMDGSLCLHF